MYCVYRGNNLLIYLYFQNCKSGVQVQCGLCEGGPKECLCLKVYAGFWYDVLFKIHDCFLSHTFCTHFEHISCIQLAHPDTYAISVESWPLKSWPSVRFQGVLGNRCLGHPKGQEGLLGEFIAWQNTLYQASSLSELVCSKRDGTEKSCFFKALHVFLSAENPLPNKPLPFQSPSAMAARLQEGWGRWGMLYQGSVHFSIRGTCRAMAQYTHPAKSLPFWSSSAPRGKGQVRDALPRLYIFFHQKNMWGLGKTPPSTLAQLFSHWLPHSVGDYYYYHSLGGQQWQVWKSVQRAAGAALPGSFLVRGSCSFLWCLLPSLAKPAELGTGKSLMKSRHF